MSLIKWFRSEESIIAFSVIVLTITAIAGNHFGYSVNGIEFNYSAEDPGLFGVVEWVWDSIGFLLNIISFRVDGMPALVSMFYQVIVLVNIWLLVKMIRGK